MRIKSLQLTMICMFGLLTCLLAVGGCGNGQIKPRGLVLVDGVPPKPKGSYKKDSIGFMATTHPDPRYNINVVSEIQDDGTFELNGAANDGFPPGVYTVTISDYDGIILYTIKDSGGKDLLKVDIPQGTRMITVDVKKNSVVCE